MTTSEPSRLRRAPLLLLRLAGWLVGLVCIWWLWPTHFGGATTIAVVQGNSMEPTFANGDLVLARQQAHYKPGDVVVFKVGLPGSEKRSALVVHRLKAIGHDRSVITQGDNRAVADGFTLTTADIVGRTVTHLPHGGAALHYLSTWWILALTSGLLAAIHLWPPAQPAFEPVPGAEVGGSQGREGP